MITKRFKNKSCSIAIWCTCNGADKNMQNNVGAFSKAGFHLHTYKTAHSCMCACMQWIKTPGKYIAWSRIQSDIGWDFVLFLKNIAQNSQPSEMKGDGGCKPSLSPPNSGLFYGTERFLELFRFHARLASWSGPINCNVIPILLLASTSL